MTFKDNRFPGLIVTNDGGTQFIVKLKGQPVDTFTSYENIDSEQVSPSFAAERAREYFDYMSENPESVPGMSSGGGDDAGGAALAEPPTVEPRDLAVHHHDSEDHTFDVPTTPHFQRFAPPERQRAAGGKTADELISSDDVMTRQHVDDILARTNAMPKGPARTQAELHALSAMRQEESLGQRLARILLS